MVLRILMFSWLFRIGWLVIRLVWIVLSVEKPIVEFDINLSTMAINPAFDMMQILRELEKGLTLRKFHPKKKAESKVIIVQLETRQLKWMRAQGSAPEGISKYSIHKSFNIFTIMPHTVVLNLLLNICHFLLRLNVNSYFIVVVIFQCKRLQCCLLKF